MPALTTNYASYPLRILPALTDDLEPMDSRLALPHLMALMKNTFIRAMNSLHRNAPLVDPSNTHFLSFLEYARVVVDILCIHLEGDRSFFGSPDVQGRALEKCLGSACNPSVEWLEDRLKAFRRDLVGWTEHPESYSTPAFLGHLEIGSRIVEMFEEQLGAIDGERLSATFSNDEIRSRIQDNISWFASRCDPTFLLPFILSHHDPDTSGYWPAMTAEGREAMPLLVGEASLSVWRFAPFDAITTQAKAWRQA